MQRILPTSVFTLFCFAVVQAAELPAVSTTNYSLYGEMSYSFKGTSRTFAEQLKCEVLRVGSCLKITTSVCGSNYPATVFVSDPTNSCTYIQYRAEDDTSEPAKTRGWNAASVYVSSYRMPSYMLGKLTPLWLMIQGRAERAKGDPAEDWPTAFGSPQSLEFYNQPRTVSETQGQSFWPDGFASYHESLECPDPADAERTVFSEGSFQILGWTNCAGAEFPAGFLATLKRKRSANSETNVISEARFAFTTTKIEHGPAVSPAVRGPRFSSVEDMRLFESGTLSNGFSYLSSNGDIYSDLLKEQTEHGLRLIPFVVRTLKPGAPRVGALAPDLCFETLDGKRIQLSELRGKYVVLDFWSTWCGPCVGEIPDLKETYDAFAKDNRFVMVGLSLDSDRKRLVGFLKDKEIHWPQAMLPEGFAHTVAKNYQVDAIPCLFFIGPDGKFISCFFRGHGLKQAVASVLVAK